MTAVQWWAVIVGDFDGNTGNDIVVGPFRSELAALRTRRRIERQQEAAGETPSADVVPMVGWRGFVDGR